MNYKCPCCGYYTLPDRYIHGIYYICPVCYWEDDGFQLSEPDFAGGANHVSLNQGRKNFIDFGACEIEMKIHVRPPKDDEKFGID